MLTVTLVGADGSGKSTIVKKLGEVLQQPTKFIYLGENPKAATHMLPTTRIWSKISSGNPESAGPPDPANNLLPKHPIKRIFKEILSAFRYAVVISEEWYRQCVVWYYRFRRYIVVTDRHYYLDYYFHHIHPDHVPITLASRLHGIILAKLYPKPDLILLLDAPPEILFARKGEGNIELLEKRRQEYIRLSHAIKSFHTIDASQPIELVTQQAVDLIYQNIS